MARYSGKKAVVIGGAYGVGRALAVQLLAGGAEVLLTSRTEPSVLSARRVRAPRVHVLHSSATSAAEIAVLVATVRDRLSQIDAVFLDVEAAELAPRAPARGAAFERLRDVHAHGPLFAAQRLSPLVRPGGALVFTMMPIALATSSLAAYLGSKAALRTLAAELSPREIRVNSVAPGLADASPTHAHSQVALMSPMKRHGSPDEVARSALFLAFDAHYRTAALRAVAADPSAIASAGDLAMRAGVGRAHEPQAVTTFPRRARAYADRS